MREPEINHEAAAFFQKATEDDPNDANAWLKWGNALGDLKEFEEATKKFQTATEIDPDITEAWKHWGWALDEQKKFSAAAEKYQKAAEINPKDSFCWASWGNSLGELGKYDEAEEKFQKATKLDPKNTSHWFNWGCTLYKQGAYEKAANKFQKQTEIDEGDTDGWLCWGLALDSQAKYEEAIHKFQRATEINPDDSDSWYHWGMVLKVLNKHEESVEKFKKAARLYHADANFELGISHINLGIYEEAIVFLQKSLEINDDWKAHLFLGHIYHHRLPDHELAEKNFLQAAGLSPELGTPVWAIAELREDQGRLDESERLFRKAIKIAPDDADCHARLGRFLLRSDRIDEGKASINRAISLDKDCKVALKYVQKYQLDL